MGFRLSKLGANWGLKQKTSRKLLRKIGLSGKSKWIRQFKRSFKGVHSGSVVAPSQATSATTYYHQPRTLSQMTGGV